VLEVHDFNIPDDANDHSGGSDSTDGGGDGYQGYNAGPGILQPWPRIYRFVGESDMAGNPLSRLSEHSGRARWPMANSQRAFLSSSKVLRQ
jgi:hypothetical protein